MLNVIPANWTCTGSWHCTGIAIAVLARMQSTAIGVSNLFILLGICSGRFRTGVIGGARGFIMVSSYIAKTPSGGLYSDVIVLVNYYYGNWSAKFPKN